MPRHKTQASLAKALGYTGTAISVWKRQWEGFPERHEDGWDEDEVRAWYAAAQKQRADTHPNGNPFLRRGPGTAAPPSEELEKVRRFTAQIRRIQAMRALNQLRQEEGDLIPRVEVEGMLAPRVLELNQGHEMMHRDIADQLAKLKDPRAIVAILDAEWRKLREQYARDLPLPPRKNGHGQIEPAREDPQQHPTRKRRART